jgi:hypothetical protein
MKYASELSVNTCLKYLAGNLLQARRFVVDMQKCMLQFYSEPEQLTFQTN